MKKLILIALAITCSGCYDSYYSQHSQGAVWGQQTNKPISVLVEPRIKAAPREYYWFKPKYIPDMVRAVLLGQCEYNPRSVRWVNDSQSDQCMIDKGFSYSESGGVPEGYFPLNHYCDESPSRPFANRGGHYNYELPSCRSLTQPVPRNPKDLDCFESGEAQSKGTCGNITLNQVNSSKPAN